MSYSAVNDFSLDSNPNGVWTYSYTTNGGQTLLNQTIAAADDPETTDYWWNGLAHPDSAYVGRNVSGGTESYLTIVDPVNFLRFDPQSETSADATFTAPIAATYSITGSFLGIDTNEVSHDVQILVNGNVVFNELIDAYADSQPFDLTESLASGSTVDFAVDTNPTNYNNLSTGLAATITAEPVCFMAGTRIISHRGEVAVESLQIGDSLKTLHAGYQKIKWIGTRSYDGRFIEGNKAALPICIKCHAIDNNIPARDLFVSPGHGVCVDGVLIRAARLVNGVSVVQAERVSRVTYYHIEMETHEIIFAENCPAETFMGENFRQQFQNAAAYAQLYPGEAAPDSMCLPPLDSGFQLHAIQQRIAARAGIDVSAAPERGQLRGYVDQAGPKICSGWVQDITEPEAPVCLDITADGRTVGRVLANLYRADLQEAGYGTGYHGFELLLPSGITGRIDAVRPADRVVLAWTETASAQAA